MNPMVGIQLQKGGSVTEHDIWRRQVSTQIPALLLSGHMLWLPQLLSK